MNIINITKIFEHILLLSAMGSIVAIGILLIKGAFRQKLSAGFHYYIWFLLLMRLILPFQVDSPFSIMKLVPQGIHEADSNDMTDLNLSTVPAATHNYLDDNNTYSTNHDQVKTNPVTKNKSFPLNAIALIWLIGMAIIMIYIIIVNLILFIKIKKYATCNREDILRILEECKARLKVNTNVSIVYKKEIKSPMVWGFLHPKIIISPEILDRLTQEELKYIFLHELSHLKRKDQIVNIACMMVQILHWFNPIIWYAIFKMKQDCEISCDAAVLNVLIPEENKNYGLTIIDMMKMVSDVKWMPGTVGFANKYHARRIIMITLHKKASLKWTVAALLALTLLTGCSSLTSSSNQTSADNTPNTTSQNEQNVQTQEDTETTDQDSVDTTTDTTTDNTTDDTKDVTTEENSTGNDSSSSIETNDFVNYLNFLGLSKEDLISSLGEEPTTIDEGGLEFKKAGIRIWFKEDKISQVFTQSNDINFNGAKIGDKIDEFKKVFGEPESDENGVMNFKYEENAYISVNYDTNNNETYAVYFLTELF